MKIHYRAKLQVAPEELTIPSLDAKGIKRVQAILGELIFYGLEVYNKLLVALKYIGTQQATAT